MKVYRIAKRQFINDLSGEGARRYGGRWNRKGSSVLYTASSRALATVEYLVHLPMALAPKDLCIAELVISDTIAIEQIELSQLSDGWDEHPAPSALAMLGEMWLRQAQSAVLKVPSAVVKDEWNLLINPLHADFTQISIQSVESYQFDKRLLRQ